MAVKNIVSFIPLTSVSATTFDGLTYMPINPGGTPEPLFSYSIINDSSVDIFISYDGVTNHDFVQSGGTISSPLQYNALPNTYIANLAKGTVVYVIGSAGTGTVYLSGQYQPQA